MLTIVRHVGSKCHTCHIEIAGVFQMTRVAAFKNLTLPKQKEIDLPEKYRRLYIGDKTPQFVQGNQQVGAFKIRRLPRDLSLIRGPELIHNKLQYGHIGIQALNGGYLQYAHMNNIRTTLNRFIDEKKSYAVWRIEYPWRPYTRKPASVRMGAGKGAIKDFSVPVKANRMLLEVGGDIELQKLWRVLKHISGQTPMNSRVVTTELLKQEAEVAEKLTKTNVNLFSFGDCARKNYMGIKKEMSPYDFIWHGKYK
ncbi:39S ribosomal protein L16, mitochondrial-like [Mizuhopecten yessoensis]|uniref:Large ribosomal subunit protein uL16m n=1 Tax=Mizuhopecten yessoensis TaxID=6573 RepID=A0A210PIX9_MIZYE|nr:39S ribosomal protein L16, mitochondrial-like [Mizuhopecten yessoensis]OWF36423.1 39S ribosomal protein L16, mitochondrial [Mizuhopecten yessoensis]